MILWETTPTITMFNLVPHQLAEKYLELLLLLLLLLLN